MMTIDLKERFIKKKAPLKAEEIIEAGYNYKEILEMEKTGEIIRFKSGYYTCKEVEISEEDTVLGLFTDGVFTMETALFYHGYLTERPFYWSIAVSKNTSKSRFKIDYPLIHPYYTENEVLSLGVCTKKVGDMQISLYNKERLICEVLKYEEKMDREDFKTAIRAFIDEPEKNVKAFLDFAKERRVLKKARTVIGPWL